MNCSMIWPFAAFHSDQLEFHLLSKPFFHSYGQMGYNLPFPADYCLEKSPVTH